MTRLPLCRGYGPSTPVALTSSGEIFGVGDLARDARALAGRLPEAEGVLNFCRDRYRFLVGYAAALLRGQPTVLPPDQTRGSVERMEARFGRLTILADSPLELGRTVLCVEAGDGPADTNPLPDIDADQVAAILFTSGSTGEPKANGKRWGDLVRLAGLTGERLGVRAGGMVIATVPTQHMYGLEHALMLPLQHGCAIYTSRPLLPADLRRALEVCAAPRVLVTTPTHIRACLAGEAEWPRLDWMLSATAPLPTEMAKAAEARWHAPLYEIYGSTETGNMATRRPARDALWTTLPGVRMVVDGGAFRAEAPHYPAPVVLNDILELRDDTHFNLLGRSEDLLNIAGKRASLGDLNLKLAAIEGVEDGAFFMPEDTSGEVTRLMAFVVAPGRESVEILECLRTQVDPVFLPRPLVKLDALPRNASGKLPRRELQALADRHLHGAVPARKPLCAGRRKDRS